MATEDCLENAGMVVSSFEGFNVLSMGLSWDKYQGIVEFNREFLNVSSTILLRGYKGFKGVEGALVVLKSVKK